jgi:Lrp/AsnC family transcriptional regulator of ectoine degradation
LPTSRATPCWARLDRLKAAGSSGDYHADIALDRICEFHAGVVTVSLAHHRKADFDRFEAFVRRAGRDHLIASRRAAAWIT